MLLVFVEDPAERMMKSVLFVGSVCKTDTARCVDGCHEDHSTPLAFLLRLGPPIPQR